MSDEKSISFAVYRAQVEMEFLLARMKRQENAKPYTPLGWSKAALLTEPTKEEAKEVLRQSLSSTLWKMK